MRHPALVDLPKNVRDRDVFQDKEGRVYVTLGYIQPQDRILSFLKYVRDPKGMWKADNERYRRIFWGGTHEAAKGMNTAPSNYLIDDPHFGASLLEVPREDVIKYFSPELRLQEILEEGPHDPLEASTKRMAETLHDTLGIPFAKLGIAGSIVWKAHNPQYSDINMCVYGYQHGWQLEKGYYEVEQQNKHMRLRKVSEWTDLILRIVDRVDNFNFEDMHVLFQRRKELCCEEKCIGVMPILYPEESPILYGSESYEVVHSEPVRVNVEIENADYGIFLPALYEVNSNPLEIIDGNRITRLMVYEGSFRALIRLGDKLDVVGTLQKVYTNPNYQKTDEEPEAFYQIMVGTKQGATSEFIRVIQ